MDSREILGQISEPSGSNTRGRANAGNDKGFFILKNPAFWLMIPFKEVGKGTVRLN